MTRRVRSILLRFIAAPSLVLWGCAGGPADVAGEKATDAQATDEINGQLLQSVDLGDGQKIDFYEFADEKLAATEVLPMDIASRSRLDKLPQHALTLSEIYRLVKPEERDVPAVLADADARQAQYQSEHALLANAPPPPVEHPSETLGANESVLGEDLAAAASTGCSPDYYGDGYGAQWFMDNFCNQTQQKQHHHWCLTNRTSGDSGGRDASWWSWVVMAPDFVLPATIRTSHEECLWDLFTGCNWIWVQDMKKSIPPRNIGYSVYTSSGTYEGWAEADPSCRRVHYANLWD